jgi:hypothetical protein
MAIRKTTGRWHFASQVLKIPFFAGRVAKKTPLV